MAQSADTTSVAHAEDRLEVLDNGARLGYVDVIDGKWSYSAPALPVGDHRLTAGYGGKTSVDWRITIETPYDLVLPPGAVSIASYSCSGGNDLKSKLATALPCASNASTLLIPDPPALGLLQNDTRA